MAIAIPSTLIEFILLGPFDDRRQLQDSPILGDVWTAYGKAPDEPLSLLISPIKGTHAGSVAAAIDDELDGRQDRDTAYLQGVVLAQLTFDELLRIVVPKTKWWINKKSREVSENRQDSDDQDTFLFSLRQLQDQPSERLATAMQKVFQLARDWHAKKVEMRLVELPTLQRLTALSGLFLWAGKFDFPKRARRPKTLDETLSFILNTVNRKKVLQENAKQLSDSLAESLADPTQEPLVYQISLNRSAMPALTRSVPAVKADAARTLFTVDCSAIAWAVIDSGINAGHPAFGSGSDYKTTRVKRSFDFRDIRRIVSLSNAKSVVRKRNITEIMKRRAIMLNAPDDPDDLLSSLAQDARQRAPINWEIAMQFLEIKPETLPISNHGTHVAGILGANKAATFEEAGGQPNFEFADGMCPDIALYDFRVLGPGLQDTEFAIIAALQCIRYLNERDRFFTIHGANLSLSIPHDVRNYACGRTPICEECERLVESGVVVVAAAGNHGYKSFQTADGSFESYAAFSVTDPGNADSVLTVGSTHRFWPHTYGVSFFSSRGPTGDGRLKPDLVAPGERICAPLLHNEWGDLDGTSMAAPHVSGAAAMLMARYSELVGNPRRIKRILCDSATDLGRERSFQGHGMLDVLRAFQSI